MANYSLNRQASPSDVANHGISYGVSWSPDGKILMMHGSNSPYLWAYSFANGVLTPISNANLGATAVGETRPGAWSNDSRWYIYAHIGGSPYTKMLRNNGDGTFTQITAPAATNFIGNVSISPDNSVVVLSRNQAPWLTIQSFDTASGAFGAAKTITYSGTAPAARIYESSWSPDGNFLLCTSFTAPYYYLFRCTANSANAITLQRIMPTSDSAPTGAIYQGAWHPDSTRFALYSADLGLRIYSVGGSAAAFITNYSTAWFASSAVHACATFSKDGKTIFVGFDSNIGALTYTRATDAIVAKDGNDSAPPTTVTRLAASPDNKYLAVASNDSAFFALYKVFTYNVTGGTMARRPSTAAAFKNVVRGVTMAPHPTTKTVYGAYAKGMTVAPRPKTATVFGVSIRAAALANRPTSISAFTYRVFGKQYFSFDTGSVKVKGTSLGLTKTQFMQVNAASQARGPQTKALLTSPNYANMVAQAAKAGTQANLYVPFAIRAWAMRAPATTSAGLFIPPFEVSGASMPNRPQTKSLILVPILLTALLRWTAPTMSGLLTSKNKLEGNFVAPAPRMQNSFIGALNTTYGTLKAPAPSMSGVLKTKWEVSGQFIVVAPRMTGSIYVDLSIKVEPSIMRGAAPSMSGVLSQIATERRRTINIIK